MAEWTTKAVNANKIDFGSLYVARDGNKIAVFNTNGNKLLEEDKEKNFTNTNQLYFAAFKLLDKYLQSGDYANHYHIEIKNRDVSNEFEGTFPNSASNKLVYDRLKKFMK